MERSLASFAFTISAVMFALLIGSWWMQHTVFNADHTQNTAEAILQDGDIRDRLATVISTWVAPDLGKNQTEVYDLLDQVVLPSRAGAAEAADMVGRVHEVVIGDTDDEQVVVTGAQLVPLVRDQRATDAPDLVLPFETIGTLKTINSILTWTQLVSAALGLLTLIAGVVLRPEPGDVRRALIEFFGAVAISLAVFGYLIPVYALPAIDNRTWVSIAPRLAMSSIELVLGMIAICVALAVVLLVTNRGGNTRRQWSTPLAAHRFGADSGPRWSR